MAALRSHVPACVGALALALGLTVTAAVPAVAGGGPLIAQNVAAGSFVPPGGIITSGPNGLAASPPDATTVVPNTSIPGLLTTGTTTDTAGTATAYSKVTNVSAATSWAVGATTYTFKVSAHQVTSDCTVTPLAATAAITGGTLTETAQTGAQVTSQVLNLPQAPAKAHSYAYHGGTVTLNFHVKFAGLTGGILIQTPDQPLAIAVTGCSPTIRIID
jgi:hypothetical protein